MTRKKVTLTVYVRWSGSNVSICVCALSMLTYSDSSGAVVFGAGKSTVRLNNCQTIHMHIGSSASMPGNIRRALFYRINKSDRERYKDRKQAHRDGRKKETEKESNALRI